MVPWFVCMCDAWHLSLSLSLSLSLFLSLLADALKWYRDSFICVTRFISRTHSLSRSPCLSFCKSSFRQLALSVAVSLTRTVIRLYVWHAMCDISLAHCVTDSVWMRCRTLREWPYIYMCVVTQCDTVCRREWPCVEEMSHTERVSIHIYMYMYTVWNSVSKRCRTLREWLYIHMCIYTVWHSVSKRVTVRQSDVADCTYIYVYVHSATQCVEEMLHIERVTKESLSQYATSLWHTVSHTVSHCK